MMFSPRAIIASLLGATVFVVASPVALDVEQRWDTINSPSDSTQNSCNGASLSISVLRRLLVMILIDVVIVGQAQCCQTIHQTNDQQFQALSSMLGLSIPADNLMTGVQCSPIANTDDLLSGSSSCNSQPICCSGNK